MNLAESARAVAGAAHSASRGTLAAILTLMSGFVIGVIGFLRFAQLAASQNNTLMLEVAGRHPANDVTWAAPVAFTMLSGLAFALGTPTGWLSSYLLLSGFVRCLAAAAGERRGDPIVGLARRLLASRHRRRDARSAAAELSALCGEEVADRVVPAEQLGIPGARWVVVASRPKPEWTPGTVLDCGDRWLTVGVSVSRTFPVGLRTLYPLVETPEAGVIRRVVRYAFPPGVK